MEVTVQILGQVKENVLKICKDMVKFLGNLRWISRAMQALGPMKIFPTCCVLGGCDAERVFD